MIIISLCTFYKMICCNYCPRFTTFNPQAIKALARFGQVQLALFKTHLITEKIFAIWK